MFNKCVGLTVRNVNFWFLNRAKRLGTSCHSMAKRTFPSPHMAELCLMMFHTLVSSALPQTSSLSKLKYKCGWIDGWGKIRNTSGACVCSSFFLSSILICCRSPFAHSHCVLFPDYGCRFPREDTSDRQTDRHPCRFSICAVAQLRLPWTWAEY